MTDRESFETTRERLRQAKLRVTPTRVAVFDCLASSDVPLTHVEVFERLNSFSVDKSTVFRVLQDFVQVGFARRIDIGDHTWRFEFVSEKAGPQSSSHAHLLCNECGSITNLDDSEIKLRVPESAGVVEDIVLRGKCSPCVDQRSLVEPSQATKNARATTD
ncbi:MAG TPA: Fur family transcriptional regulator [Pirellulaceae bacterium]|nr:Fur family transcriptional regulator [Pirellulaceae bacterium]